jgi:hypothetical protein
VDLGYPLHVEHVEGGAVQLLQSDALVCDDSSTPCLMTVENVDSWRQVWLPPQLGQRDTESILAIAFWVSNCWSQSLHL